MSTATIDTNETLGQSSNSLLGIPIEPTPSISTTTIPTQSHPLIPSPEPKSELAFTTTRYRLRYTAHELYINDELIPYDEQIVHMDKFYIVKTNPSSKLKTPIILHRNKQLDTLDRRIFMKRFSFELIKSLEICSFSDAVFICERIPKQVKYFVNVIQGLSLVRWKMLLMNDAFFIEFYACLEGLITKKSLMSPLRKDMVEDLLKTRLTNCHSRLFYMIENLVLENEDLRNTITTLTRNIVMEQMSKKRFFEKYILMPSKNNNNNINNKQSIIISERKYESDDSNDDDYETNSEQEQEESEQEQESSLSSSETETELLKLTKTTTINCFPEHFLQNIINITKSSLRLKLPKQFITKTFINFKLFNVLRQFFKEFFETQSELLMEVLSVLMDIEPVKLWEVVFGNNCEEVRDKNIKEKEKVSERNLILLEVMLSNKIREYVIREERKHYSNQNKFTTPHEILTNPFTLITQLLTQLQSNHHQKKFTSNLISKSLLTSSTPNHEELELILNYLELSIRDMIVNCNDDNNNGKCNNESYCENKEGKVESYYQVLIKKVVRSIIKRVELLILKLKKDNVREITNNSYNSKTFLSLQKTIMIVLLKLFKLLIKHEKLLFTTYSPFNLESVDYLLEITRYRKGVIEGVRLELISTLENSANNDSSFSVSSLQSGDVSILAEE